ncbi:histidine-tRNA ligase [Acanthamoeba castellanii str. Neff]|uniref:histidine--tRNA ligase n=1 Tax=Acanthamoeba castellanii (strain ATCC 30010 / Neff) TaxID=1257118 RepID=L8HIB4_ACACF|nr:histidine-tRNA ligase [Acanthamoeba castellanii str. Neff]ELR24438.1 histidine-tRNA ligase [Acanthamoeba castellanii str. Neff]
MWPHLWGGRLVCTSGAWSGVAYAVGWSGCHGGAALAGPLWLQRGYVSSAAAVATGPVGGAPRGTHDIEGGELAAHRFIVDTARRVASRYAFEEVQTPMFETTQVFQRSLGGDSDVVMKEMYTFDDKGGNSLTLRPEGTAGVVRAFVSKKDFGDLPRRYFYSGPMFRYERPQKGRLRQFHQLEVNSLGDAESRERYRTALREYLSTQRTFLSADSVLRLDRGSELRVLDSKDASDQQVVRAAECPVLVDYLSEQSRDHFQQVCGLLTQLDLSFVVNPRLVRGLDYYGQTVFEFVGQPGPQLGPQQATLLAGGVYDSLVSTFGGPAISGVGWAAGVERLALVLDRTLVPTPPRPLYVLLVATDDLAPADDTISHLNKPAPAPALVGYAMRVSEQLRRDGFVVVQKVDGSEGSGGKLRKWMKKAVKANAAAAVFVGADELAANAVTLKLLDTGDQRTVALPQLADALHQHRPSAPTFL